MDFALTEHQQDVQRRARMFAASQVAPVASELDRKGSIPAAIIAGAAEVGLLGCERDFVAYVAGLIEISREWASLGAVIAVHNSLVCYPIARYGDSAQKNTFLTRLTDKRELGCYAFAEPLAGSDAGAIRYDGDRRWRSFRPQRPQAIRHRRPPGTHRHRLCADGFHQGSRRLVRLHCRHRHAWLHRR